MVELIGTLILTWLVGTGAGWFVHWLMHQPWTGALYQGHMSHHRRYPRHNLVSTDYRYTGGSDSLLVFLPTIALPVLGLLLALKALHCSDNVLFVALTFSTFVGGLHDWIHIQIHLRGSKLLRYRWFWTLRALHFEHHKYVQKNLGVLWFVWDDLLDTYQEPTPPRIDEELLPRQ